MRQTILGGTASAIGWGVLVMVLVLSPTLGSASSVLALALMLMLTPAAGRPGAFAEILQAPAQLMFIGVVVVLTLAYAITAREPTDVLFFANFLAMPLSAVVYLIAREQAGRATALLVIRLCVLGALVGLGFALFDIFARGLERAQGLIGNANLMPRIALTLGFVGMAGVFVDTGVRRFIYAVAPVAAIATTFLCGSRGAALAIPGMVLIAAIFLWQERSTRIFVIVGGVLTAAAALVAVIYMGPTAFERFAGIANVVTDVLQTGNAGGDGPTQERLVMYQTGLEAFGQAPWLGWGWANLGNAAAELNPAVFAAEAGTAFMYHNDVVNFAVAGGVVGIACLAVLVLAPIVGALASPRDAWFRVRLYCCLILGVGFAIFGLTDSTLGYDAPTTLYAFLTAMVLGAFRETPKTSAGGPAARP
jgi:O-antigen ligase